MAFKVRPQDWQFNIRGCAGSKTALARLTIRALMKAAILEGAVNTGGNSVPSYAAFKNYSTAEIPCKSFHLACKEEDVE